MANPVCSAVHHALCITAYGAINPCCSSRDFVHIDDVPNIKDYFYNNQHLEKSRQVELTDQWLPECSACKKKVENGIDSRKDKLLRWFPHVDKQFTETNKYAIIHMDISFGNSCNQKCIMCNSNFSSQWLKDDIVMVEEAPYIRNKSLMHLKNWSLSYDQLDQIADLVSEYTQKIEIKGGEPLYDKRFEYFVNKVIEKNPHVYFNTNTNGSHFNQKNIDMLNKIHKIGIDISFDGTGKIYEWIRNSSWEESEKNYIECLKHIKHNFVLNYTTMVYNVDHIEKFYNWAADLSQQYNREVPIHFTQIVTNPKYMDPIYASKDRIVEGIRQIKKIKNDPRGFASKSMIFGRSLETLQSYLENGLKQEVDYSIYDRTHEYMTKIRGWDIKDHVDM